MHLMTLRAFQPSTTRHTPRPWSSGLNAPYGAPCYLTDGTDYGTWTPNTVS